MHLEERLLWGKHWRLLDIPQTSKTPRNAADNPEVERRLAKKKQLFAFGALAGERLEEEGGTGRLLAPGSGNAFRNAAVEAGAALGARRRGRRLDEWWKGPSSNCMKDGEEEEDGTRSEQRG